MIWVFIVSLILIIIFLEKKLPDFSLKHLSVNNSINTNLAEPDEQITIKSKVHNTGFFPIMYVKLTEHLPLKSLIIKKNSQNHQIGVDNNSNYIQFTTYLLPHMRRTFQFDFSLPDRGIYDLGSYTLTAGDYLGIKDSSVSDKSPISVVIMPRRAKDTKAFKAFDSFIGDISVRRFIHEDPVLTVGFREYTGHEPFKSISWLKTARTGSLYVNQYDHTTDISLSVVLNTENASKSRLEACYSLTRSVCEELEHKHIPYAFYSNGNTNGDSDILSHISEGLGRRHLNTILYGLGCAEHKCTRSFETLMKQCIKQQKSSRGYIIITPPMSTEQLTVVQHIKNNGVNDICILVGEHEKNQEK